MIHGLIDLGHRELLNHALHAVRLRERNSFFGIEGVSARPARHRQAVQHHGHGVHGHRSNRSENQQRPARRQAILQAANGIRVRGRDDNDRGSTHLLQCFARVVGFGVDVVRRAELEGEVLLIRPAAESHGAVTHLPSVLDCEMTETAETLHRDSVAGLDMRDVTDAIEDRHARTEERRDLSSISAVGDTDCGLSAQRGVLAVASLAEDAVDGLVLAHLELAAIAGAAGVVVAAVPGAADAVADLPLLLRWGDLDDGADVLVAEHLDLAVRVVSGIGLAVEYGGLRGDDLRWAHVAGQDVVIGVADTAGVHLQEELAVLDVGHGDFLDLERFALAHEAGGLHRLGD